MNQQPLLPLYQNETPEEEAARLRRIKEIRDAQPHPSDDPCTAFSKWLARNSQAIGAFGFMGALLVGMKELHQTSQCNQSNQGHYSDDSATEFIRGMDLAEARRQLAADNVFHVDNADVSDLSVQSDQGEQTHSTGSRVLLNDRTTAGEAIPNTEYTLEEDSVHYCKSETKSHTGEDQFNPCVTEDTSGRARALRKGTKVTMTGESCDVYSKTVKGFWFESDTPLQAVQNNHVPIQISAGQAIAWTRTNNVMYTIVEKSKLYVLNEDNKFEEAFMPQYLVRNHRVRVTGAQQGKYSEITEFEGSDLGWIESNVKLQVTDPVQIHSFDQRQADEKKREEKDRIERERSKQQRAEKDRIERERSKQQREDHELALKQQAETAQEKALMRRSWTVKKFNRGVKRNKEYETMISFDRLNGEEFAVVLKAERDTKHKEGRRILVENITDVKIPDSEKKKVSIFTTDGPVNGPKYKIKCKTEEEAAEWWAVLERFRAQAPSAAEKVQAKKKREEEEREKGRTEATAAGTGARPDNVEGVIRHLGMYDCCFGLLNAEKYEFRDLRIAEPGDLQEIGLTPEQARRIVTYFRPNHPEYQPPQ